MTGVGVGTRGTAATWGGGDVEREGELGKDGTEVGSDEGDDGGGDGEPPSIHSRINSRSGIPPLAVGSRYRAFILPQILGKYKRGKPS